MLGSEATSAEKRRLSMNIQHSHTILHIRQCRYSNPITTIPAYIAVRRGSICPMFPYLLGTAYLYHNKYRALARTFRLWCFPLSPSSRSCETFMRLRASNLQSRRCHRCPFVSIFPRLFMPVLIGVSPKTMFMSLNPLGICRPPGPRLLMSSILAPEFIPHMSQFKAVTSR